VTRRQNRVFVALKLPGKVPDLLSHARAILEACSKHPLLVSPTPSMAELATLVAELGDRQTDLAVGGPGKRAARDVALDRLRHGLTTLGQCVEDQASLDLDHAEAFIAAAFMTTRARSTRRKQPFTVTDGPVSGTVVVEVRAAGDTVRYKWLSSLDGGTTWLVARLTTQCKTTLTGLPAGTYVHFRCEVMVKTGVATTTEPIVFLVK
jgi:hypothetical protein